MIKIEIYKPSGELVSDSNQYKSYSFDSQYGVPADAFSAVLVDNNADIQAGYEIKFFVDGAVGFRGIVERKQRSYSKTGRTVTISGKDRSFVLVKGYCSSFKDFNNQVPKTITDNLIGQTNFYTKKKSDTDEKSDSTGFNSSTDLDSVNSAIQADIDGNEFLNSVTDRTIYDQDFTGLSARVHFKISIGDKVWDKILQLVSSVGYEILYQENGSLYIGDLQKKRLDENIIHELTRKKDGSGNILECDEVDDISGRYSSVSVYSTPEGNTGIIASIGTSQDSTVPIKSNQSVTSNNDNTSAQKMAIKLREEQRQDGYSINYTVAGHIAENGKIWSINRTVNIQDDFIDVSKTMIIYGRTFVFSEGGGAKTILRIGKPKNFQANL